MKLKHSSNVKLAETRQISNLEIKNFSQQLIRSVYDISKNIYDDLYNIAPGREDSLPTASVDYLGKIMLIPQAGADDKVYICIYDANSETYEWIEIGRVDSLATKALDNLASVAINTSLISDTDDTDDLGSSSKQWKDLYIDGLAYIDGLGENIDFNQKQALQLVIENRTSDPGSPVTGQIWFRTDL